MRILLVLAIVAVVLQHATAFKLFNNRFFQKSSATEQSAEIPNVGTASNVAPPSGVLPTQHLSALQSTVLKPSAGSTVVDRNFQQNLKLGVLFLNLGGPETIEDVEGFLFNLFADPDIIRLPPLLSFFQKPIAYFISKRRAPKSASAYESIGGGSPIVKYTREQSTLVRDVLRRRGFDKAECYFAMRYWHPYTEEALEQIQKDGVNTLVVVPLYPQFSISTSGSSLRLLQDIFYKQPQIWGPEKVAHTVVPSWYHRPGYSKVMAKLILDKIQNYSEEDMSEGLHVLFSAHGVPQSYIAAGDPYQRQIEECVNLISNEVRSQLASDVVRPATINKAVALQLAGSSAVGSESSTRGPKDMAAMAEEIFENAAATHAVAAATPDGDSSAIKQLEFHLSFQSRVGPVKWLQPYTEEMLQELGKDKNVKNLIVVPISFVSEHIETLEEIDMEYRELAEECGITNWQRVPALNTDKAFIEDMADLVVEALESPTLTVAEAASNSYSDVLENSGAVTGPDSPAAVEASRKLRGAFTLAGVLSTSALEVLTQHPILTLVGLK